MESRGEKQPNLFYVNIFRCFSTGSFILCCTVTDHNSNKDIIDLLKKKKNSSSKLNFFDVPTDTFRN